MNTTGYHLLNQFKLLTDIQRENAERHCELKGRSWRNDSFIHFRHLSNFKLNAYSSLLKI